MSRGSLDYAIVGAGVSGLYVAWRILEANRDARVHVFDCLDDVGGRLRSVPLPGLPFTAEVGGMRFKTSHLLLYGAVQRLGLPTRKFDYPFLFGSLRGRNYSPAAPAVGTCTGCGATNGYFLDPHECASSPEGLLLRALLSIIRDLTFDNLAHAAADNYKISISKLQDVQQALGEGISTANLPEEPLAILSPGEWEFIQRHARLADRHLYDYGFWQILTLYLSNEAFQYIRNALGYESIVSNWNAAEAIIWFLSEFASAEYIAIRDGFQSFPRAMAKTVLDLGGELSLHHKLTKIFRESGETQSYTLSFLHGHESVTLSAANVFLCMPKGALLHIEGLVDLMKEPALLESVQHRALFKMLFGYRDSWWLKDSRFSLAGKAYGKAITDTPLRQIYYFGSEPNNDDIQARPDTPSMLMVSYSDEQYVEFWRPSEGVNRNPYFGGKRDDLSGQEIQLLEELGTTESMVTAASKLIECLHPGIEVPRPHVAIYKDWRDAPFYAGWHTWRVGTKPWDIRLKLMRAAEGIHICGEAFSSEQGWVEGALKSAELGLEAAGFKEGPPWILREIFEARGFKGHANYTRF